MKLIEICDFQGGSQPPKEEWSFEEKEGYIRMLQIRDFTQSDRVIPEYIKISNNTKICEANDILIARYGASIGKILTGLAGAYNVALMRTIPDTRKIKKKYLYYYLKSPYFQNAILNVGSRAAQAGFNKEDLSKLDIECPKLSEQENIVSILDKVEIIIEKRREELAFLDDLIKARFVEMFGDAIYNDKGWETDEVEKLCKEIYGGGTPSKLHPEYYEDGDIPWISSKDMKTDVLTDSQIKINQLGVDNSTARMVPINSVIMVIRSGILKHTLPVAINAVPITVNQDLKVFIPNERVLTRFLAVQFKMHEKNILSGVRTVTADNIEFNSLKQRKLIVPPIELQQEYVSFLEQTDKSKVAVQKALDETQTLFDSIMQEYFG
jgi:type I restriction enzyme S subunit